LQILCQAAFQVGEAGGGARHVALRGEQRQIVGLAGGGQRRDEPQGVTRVDVLVDQAVDQQQLTP